MLDIIMGFLAIILLIWSARFSYKQAVKLGKHAVKHDKHFDVHVGE